MILFGNLFQIYDKVSLLSGSCLIYERAWKHQKAMIVLFDSFTQKNKSKAIWAPAPQKGCFLEFFCYIKPTKSILLGVLSHVCFIISTRLALCASCGCMSGNGRPLFYSTSSNVEACFFFLWSSPALIDSRNRPRLPDALRASIGRPVAGAAHWHLGQCPQAQQVNQCKSRCHVALSHFRWEP